MWSICLRRCLRAVHTVQATTHKLKSLLDCGGIEPATFRLLVQCSTNLDINQYICVFLPKSIVCSSGQFSTSETNDASVMSLDITGRHAKTSYILFNAFHFQNLTSENTYFNDSLLIFVFVSYIHSPYKMQHWLLFSRGPNQYVIRLRDKLFIRHLGYIYYSFEIYMQQKFPSKQSHKSYSKHFSYQKFA